MAKPRSFDYLYERLRRDPGLPVKNPTKSHWQEPLHESVATLQSPELPSEANVVVIGSGITGCSVAKQLLESDHSVNVVVLEARNICSGATGRNGGHIKATPEHTYSDFISVLGQDRTREVVRFTLANVEALMELSAQLPEKLQEYGEVRRVEALNLFTTEETFADFAAAVRALAEADPDLEGRGRLIAAEELRAEHGVFHGVGGYLSCAGAAWPYRLITGIFSQLLKDHRDRFNVEANTPVDALGALGDGTYIVHTSRGSIKAKSVVHATNGYAAHLLPGLRGPLFPVRGQMTAQSPTKVAEKYGGKRSWSIAYDSGFDYITQSISTREIFAGGGLAQSYDHGLLELGNTDDSSNSNLSLAHLGGAMNATFGIEDDQAITSSVKRAWTGVMGFTADGLPLVGRLPQAATLRQGDGEWIAAGFNGYGMVNAWLCGKHVADQILRMEEVQAVPHAYVISTERLKSLSAEHGANHWIAHLGLR